MLQIRPKTFYIEVEAQSFAFKGPQAGKRGRLRKYCAFALLGVARSAEGLCLAPGSMEPWPSCASSVLPGEDFPGSAGTSDPCLRVLERRAWAEMA